MSERGDFTPQGLLSESLLNAQKMRRLVIAWTDAKGIIHVSWSTMSITTVMGLLEIAKQSAYEELGAPGEPRVDDT